MELKLTQKDVSDVFAYLNKQPYEFSQPLFKWFYDKIKEQSVNEAGISEESKPIAKLKKEKT